MVSKSSRNTTKQWVAWNGIRTCNCLKLFPLCLVFYCTLCARYIKGMNMVRSDLPLAYLSIVSAIPKPFSVKTLVLHKLEQLLKSSKGNLSPLHRDNKVTGQNFSLSHTQNTSVYWNWFSNSVLSHLVLSKYHMNRRLDSSKLNGLHVSKHIVSGSALESGQFSNSLPVRKSWLTKVGTPSSCKERNLQH